MYRIRRTPDSKREKVRYYAQDQGRVHWTQFREVAATYNTEEVANHICTRIINANGKLAHKVTVEPC